MLVKSRAACPTSQHGMLALLCLLLRPWAAHVQAQTDSCPPPILDSDLPDPDILFVEGAFFLFSTNNETGNVPVLRSRDLRHWESLPDALPQVPVWAEPGWTWAPEVTRRPDRRGYVMYFTARHQPSEAQCIGVATSDSPEGPYDPVSREPLVCPLEEGGAIDASAFLDADGEFYLLWKTDGNCCGFDTWIKIQKLTRDGLALVGDPTSLIKQDQSWEGELVEAPTLWREHDRYFLFYSANWYDEHYSIGYAEADQVLGPYRKAASPLLTSSEEPARIVGPGGQDIVLTAKGERLLLFHGWSTDLSYRGVSFRRLDWEQGKPVLGEGNGC
jgi:arabinan endo-1,5-alpha-L-arabinosidase